MTEPKLADDVVLAARQQAEAIAIEVSGVVAVVIATVDGFDVASSARGAADAQRIAALASSIAAIGDVVSSEAGLGRSRGITVATERGFVVVQQVPRRDVGLVINVIAGGDAVLAQVSYRTAQAVRLLAQA
jgi:predicted regulator of Ras-like GTPase activity (Roadblock/LC7/MglB family)